MHEVNLASTPSKEPAVQRSCSARFTTGKTSKNSLIIDFTNSSYSGGLSGRFGSQSEATNRSKTILNEKPDSAVKAQRKTAPVEEKLNNAIKQCFCSDCTKLDDKQKRILQELKKQLLTIKLGIIYEKNQNQILRRNIYMAKKVVEREVGDNIDSFDSLLQKANDESWIGRQERIFILKRKLRDLNKMLEEIGSDNIDLLRWKKPKKEESLEFIPDERAFYWTLELERRDVMKNIERDKQMLVTSRDFMTQNLQPLINRNQELVEEITDLREKIASAPKTLDDDLLERLRKVGYGLKTELDGKVQDKRKLDDAEEQACRNSKIVVELRAKITLEKQIVKDKENELNKLKTDESNLRLMSEELKKEKNRAVVMMKKKLGDVEHDCRTNFLLLDKVIALINDSNLEVEKFKRPQKKCSANERKKHDLSNNEENEITREGTANSLSDIGKESESETEVLKNRKYQLYESKLQKYRSALEELRSKNFEKSEQVSGIINKAKEVVMKLMTDRYVLWKLMLDVNVLKNRLKKYQKAASRRPSKLKLVKKKNSCQHLMEALDERKAYLSILKLENKLIKASIRNVFGNNADDFELLMVFLDAHKDGFLKTVNNYET